ncbi:MAG TPA: hypothetical protein VK395_28245 [Gemmataceae bacterium]|nr:hypothetical protein [Gemmataceae bacterium]
MGTFSSAFEDPRFVARIGRLSLASDLLWYAAVAIGVGAAVIAALLYGREDPASGKFWAYAGLMLRVGLYAWARDGLRGRGGETLWRLLIMGLVAGTFELLIDWALIHWVHNGKLVYLTGNDVVLLGSPIWMPVAWACVITDMGYMALRLYGILQPRLGITGAAGLSSLVVGISGAVMVGFYEELAFRAYWWEYQKACVMVTQHCALYVPLGEALMFAAILPIGVRTLELDEDQPLAGTLLGGACFAVAIAGGYAVSYFLLEFGRTPS